MLATVISGLGYSVLSVVTWTFESSLIVAGIFVFLGVCIVPFVDCDV
jgi:hypothetical protein